MTATISRLPVAMKRGRKVTKGPKASISVIYEAQQDPREQTQLDKSIGQLGDAFARSAAKAILRKREEEAWLKASPNVRSFPEERRYRTEAAIANLRAGRDEDWEDDSPLAIEMREHAQRVGERAKQIVAEMEMETCE